MPHYVVLGKFTDEGIKEIKDGPKRLKEVRERLEKMGGKMVSWYATMGEYDFVAITEMPSDEAQMTSLLANGATGAARTETLRAFPESELSKMLERLP
jgi:uncharacterized protein with GYD domain